MYGVSVRMAAHWLFPGFMLLILGGKTETRLSVASSDLQFSYICLLIYEIVLLTNCFSCFPTNLRSFSLFSYFKLFFCPLWNVFEFFLFGMFSLFRRKSSIMRSSHLTEDLAPDFKEKYFKQGLDHFNYKQLWQWHIWSALPYYRW